MDVSFMSREQRIERNFDVWMMEVDRRFGERTGMSIYDVDDMPYRDHFDRGVRPVGMVRKVIQSVKSDW